MKTKKVWSILQSVVSIGLCVLIVTVIASLLISKIQRKPLTTVFGFGAAVVVSGSMEPALRVNDVIIIHETKTPEMNDMLLYQSGGSLVVHRVVGFEDDGKTIITKGDANNTVDQPFSHEYSVGKVILVLPGMGDLVNFLKSPYGIIAMVMLVVMIYAAMFLIRQFKKRDEDTPS